ncbi:MAG: tetratricopeptide repeat protein [Planctomycetaceae bacterium]
MFPLSRISIAMLVLIATAAWTTAAWTTAAWADDDEKKPIPATANPTAPANQPPDPNLLPAHDAARNEADQAYRRGDHKKVIESMSAVLAQNPKDHVALYLRGSSRVDLGAVSRDATLVRSGIADARQAISIKDKDNLNYYLPYLYGMTNLASLENKPAHAQVAIDFATQLLNQPTLKGEQRSNTLYQRALAHMVKPDQAKAIADYQEAIRVTPTHLGARIGLADTLAAAGQNAAAMTAYNDAVKAFPSLPLVYNNRGMFAQSTGKLDEAILDFTKALDLDPQFAVAMTNRGFVMMNLGNFEGAENDFTESLKIEAAQPMVISLRAGSKLSRGDAEAAIKDYYEVLKWDSKNAVGHAELGFALFFAGKRPEALAEFDQAAELDKKLRFLQPWRYLTMISLGQKQQADAKFAADLAIPADKREWGDALLAYLSDKLSEQDLRKVINTTDPKAADAQTCEAEFFVGQRKLLAGQKDAAKIHFANALKSKSTQLSAYRGAKFAMK